MIRALVLLVSFLAYASSASASGGVILHFSDFGPPEATSGSATVMKNLQEAQTREGKTVYLVLPEYDVKKFPAHKDPSYVIRIPRGARFQSSTAYEKIGRLMRGGHVELVHVHKEANFSRLGLSLAKKYGVPTVLTAHTMIGPFVRDHFAGKPRALKPFFDYLAKRIERDYIDFANGFDVVTAPTKIVEEYLVSRGVTRPIMVVPPGGVPIERFEYSPVPRREYMLALRDVLSDKSNSLERVALGRQAGNAIGEGLGAENRARPRKVVLMLSRLSAEKGVESVLEAWSSVVHDPAHEYHFVLAGLGGVNADSQRIYSALRNHPEAGKSIHYVGSMPYEDVPKLLAGADVVVNASRHETFGLALVEAQAAGKPVIVPDLPAFRTFLTDGAHGVFVSEVHGASLTDALRKIFRQGAYEEMSRNARANAEQFSTTNVQRQTRFAYVVAMSEQSKRAALGRQLEGNYFQTPLSPGQLCSWLMINALTKP